MKQILVPVDGSAPACRAARFAARLASETGAELTLMHVYHSNAFLVLCMSELADSEIRAAQARANDEAFQPAEAECADIGVVPKRHSCVGVPSVEIPAHAKSIGADLIVMGTRGRTPAAEMVVGSVSDRVLRRAVCPVALVR